MYHDDHSHFMEEKREVHCIAQSHIVETYKKVFKSRPSDAFHCTTLFIYWTPKHPNVIAQVENIHCGSFCNSLILLVEEEEILDCTKSLDTTSQISNF